MKGLANSMKIFIKCPVLIIIISSGLLLTIIGIGGKNNVYAAQDFNPLKAPILSVVFTGLNEDIYPWQIFGAESQTVMAEAGTEDDGRGNKEAEKNAAGLEGGDAEAKNGDKEVGTESQTVGTDDEKTSAISATAKPTSTPAPTPKPTPEPVSTFPEGRLEPLRESTHDEYMNHISADIYGDAGVLRAATYEFATVDESYFDDALFIGDSRTVGLHDYTDLAQHADFYCETSLTIYGVMDETFNGKGTVPNALANKDYGKIYIMVGINELGRGTTEDFMAQYTEVIDTLHSLEPDALIFIQGIMKVSGDKNAKDAIFNNSNINARNNAIATLADNQQIFYIDVNEDVCDEQGNLTEEYTFDQIHLLGMYNDLWKQFLLAHGVTSQNDVVPQNEAVPQTNS